MVAEPVSGPARLPNSPSLVFPLEAMAHLRGSAANPGDDAAETAGMLGPGAMIAAVAASAAIDQAVPAVAAGLQRMCPSRAKKVEEMKIDKDTNSDSPPPHLENTYYDATTTTRTPRLLLTILLLLNKTKWKLMCYV